MAFMVETFEIKPCEGFAALPFGASMEEAEELFGPAEETDTLEGAGPDEVNIVWHYWEQGFTLFFDVNQRNAFTCVEIDNRNCTLWGKRIFEMSEEQVIELFQSKGYRDIDMEEHEWGERRLSFDDTMIDFYFKNSGMISINYGVLLGDKQIYIFPN